MNKVFTYKLAEDHCESFVENKFICLDDDPIMTKRVAVVTGSNKGIGFAIVKALCAKFEGDVVLTARNENRGKNAVKLLEQEGFFPIFHVLDITKIETIKALAVFLKKQYGGLDVLVNNAAIGYLPGNPTPFLEQATNTIKTNFYGTLHVCQELFPLLRPHARIVNLSSSTARLSMLPSKELQQKFLSASKEEDLCSLIQNFMEDVKAGIHEEKGWGTCSYQVSKIALTGLTYIHHRRFLRHPHQDIVINAVHPGRVNTDLVAHNGPLTPDQGAVVPIYCALLPQNVPTPRGEYVWSDKSVISWI